MVTTLTYKQAIPAESTIAVKTGADTYDVYYPKLLNDGTCVQLCRLMAKRQFDYGSSPPTIGAETTLDVETPSTYTNPVIPQEFNLGYDFDADEILLVLGEWDTASETFTNVTDASLLSVNLALDTATVVKADLLTLAKTAVADATKINYSAHFYGYGTKYVGILGTYAGAAERSCIIKYNGAAWSAAHANSRFDYIQEAVEPIWDASNVFLGWLTEGHGTNSHFIKYSDQSIVTCYPPVSAYTTCPNYDLKNHKIVWIEYGSGVGANQYVYVADPDATSGCINWVDWTPTGSITDNEANSINLKTACKCAGTFFSDGVNEWLVMALYRGGIPEGQNRVAKSDLGQYNDPTKWAILENSVHVDTGWKGNGRERCVDPTTHRFLQDPQFQVLATNPYA